MSEENIQQPEDDIVTQQPEPSLRDSLAHALKSIKDAPEGETPEQRAERVRDEAGRFAKAPGQPKARETLTLPADKAAVGAPTAEGSQTVTPPAPAVKAPDGWTAKAKEKFATLDPEIQAEITRREADMHKQFTRQDEDRTLGKQIKEIAQPYAATIRAEGGDTLQAFQLYLNTAYIMRTGTPEAKRNALLSVAQQFNVDLGVPLQQNQTHPVIESLQQRIDRMERERQQELQQRQIQEQYQLESEIETFAAQPGHEHFHQVKALMGALLESGQANDLQGAYDQAVWANPEIRSTLTAQADAKRLTEVKATTDAARRAAGSIVGGPGGAKPVNGAGTERSLGEELRANFRAAQGRI